MNDGRARRIGALLAWSLAAGLGPALPLAARAQPATAVDVADVGVGGSDDEGSAILDAIRASLTDLGLGMRVAPPSPTPAIDAEDGARVHVWVDARATDRIEVVVSVPASRGGHSVTRSVARGDSAGVVADQVAFVVRATVESLLAEPPPPPQPSATPASVIATPLSSAGPGAPPTGPSPSGEEPAQAKSVGLRSPIGLDAAAFASGRALGVAALVGGGGGVELSPWGRRTWLPSFAVMAAAYAPVQTSAAPITLETNLYAARATAGLYLWRLGAVRLQAGLGGGIDVLHAVAQSSSTSYTVKAPSTDVDPVLSARLVASLGTLRGPSVLLALDLDYDLNPPRYDARDAARVASVILDPWRARPGLELGLSFPFLSGEP